MDEQQQVKLVSRVNQLSGMGLVDAYVAGYAAGFVCATMDSDDYPYHHVSLAYQEGWAKGWYEGLAAAEESDT